MTRPPRSPITIIAGGMLLVLAIGLTWWLMRPANDSGAAAGPLTRTDRAAPSAGTALPTSVAAVESAAPAPDALATPSPVTAGPPPIPESYRRALAGLTGRVVEEDGRPVPDLKVELGGGRKSTVVLPNDAFLRPDALDIVAIVGSAVTGPDGRFTLEGIDPRTFGVLLLDPGGPRALMHLLETTPVSGATRDLGDIVMPACATLTGTVVDDRGAPIAGARVRALLPPIEIPPGIDSAISLAADYREGGALVVAEDKLGDHDIVFTLPPSLARLERHLPIPTTTTGADGAFVLPGVPTGLVLVAVDDGVHVPHVDSNVPTGAAGGTRDLGAIALADGLTLTGHVLDGKRQPVAGAEVLAGSSLVVAPAAILKGPVRTDAKGAFRVTGLRQGVAYAVARIDSRHEFTIASTTSPDAGDLEITLEMPREVAVTVMDPEGAPVAGAQFWGRAIVEEDVPDFFLAPRSLAGQVRPAGEEDRDAGRYVIGDLHPGKWQIVIQAQGFTQDRHMVDLTAGDGSLEARLDRGTGLTVRVVRGDDQSPVEYAAVEAFDRREDMGKLVTSARTDAGGLARLADLPEGEVKINVTHPGLAITSVTVTLPSKDELLVTLLAGATVSGAVVDAGGAPTEPLLVFLMPGKAPGDAELPRTAVTDHDGRFRFERVEPGTAHLEARSRSEMTGGFDFFETFFNSPLAETEVEVPDHGETEVLLAVGLASDVQTGFVSGRISVNGRPGEGWKVRTWGAIRRSATANELGDFDLGRVEAGDVTLMLSAPGNALLTGFTESIPVKLEPEERKYVPIDFDTGSITGRLVSAADGKPVPGGSVRAIELAESSGGWGRGTAGVSDERGAFVIEPVVTGKYKLSASAAGFANLTSDAVDVRPLLPSGGIELRLQPAIVVEGTIVLQGAVSEPQWLWLVASRRTASGEIDDSTRDTSRVDAASREFKFDGLSAGTWRFELASDLGQDFEAADVTVSGETHGLVVTFHPAPEPEPEPAQVIEIGGVGGESSDGGN